MDVDLGVLANEEALSANIQTKASASFCHHHSRHAHLLSHILDNIVISVVGEPGGLFTASRSSLSNKIRERQSWMSQKAG